MKSYGNTVDMSLQTMRNSLALPLLCLPRHRTATSSAAKAAASRTPVDLANLPPATIKLNVRKPHADLHSCSAESTIVESPKFRALPFTPEALALTADKPALRSLGPAKEAKEHCGFIGKTVGYAWSCEYFAIRVIPPPPSTPDREGVKRVLKTSKSPFPNAVPRLSTADHASPSAIPAVFKALDGYDGAAITADERKRLQDHSYTMDLTFVVSKKSVHKLAVVRSQIRKRFTAAVRLAVQQGVSAGADGVYLQDLADRGPHHWLLPGHRYVVHTTLECLRLPLPDLLQRVRLGLKATRVSFGPRMISCTS